MKTENFHRPTPARPGILDALRRDADRMAAAGDQRRLQFCFVGDPFDEAADADGVTLEALQIMVDRGLKFSVLTKGGMRAEKAFPLIAQGGTFGTSLVWAWDGPREMWEPGAATVGDRLYAVFNAAKAGIYTWASVEPVIEPAEALLAIDKLARYGCREVRIGRRRGDNSQDWSAFCAEAARIIEECCLRYQVKASLGEFWPEGLPLDNRGDKHD